MSDGCTLFLDHFMWWDWRACCAAHDLAYGAGVDKVGADLELLRCVGEGTGWPLAIPMFLAVSLFGWHWWGR